LFLPRTLESPRLYFRKFSLEDAPLILELNSYEEVVKYVHEPVLTNIEQAQRVIQRSILPQYQLYDLGRYAIHEKATNNFIGWCGLKYRLEIHEVDLGYRLHPSAWGKGYGKEAALSTLAYGFNQKKLPRIVGRAHIENAASLTILKSIGLHYLCHETIDDCPVETWHLYRHEFQHLL